VILSKYLEHSRGEALEGVAVLELGAGTGIVGASAATMGAAPVVVTDLEYALPSLDWAAQKLRKRLRPLVLDWTAPDLDSLWEALGDEPPQLIVGADIVWLEELVEPLVKTLELLVARCGDTPVEIVMAHQTRAASVDRAFFSLLERSFRWEIIPPGETAPGFETGGNVFLFRATPIK
jgi:predicted nicotinamide N-methyase